ncbi:MAG: hypothetical protein NC177_12800 [Ruminococcus flavefaciens]|nr:hypothetical protein [Ruminococcus flavefaciens]
MKDEDYQRDANGVKKFKNNQNSNSSKKSIACLIFGILSLIFGVIPAVIASSLGKNDVSMPARIGKICALISIILWIVFIIGNIIIMIKI